VYTKDLASLLNLLSVSSQSGTLRIESADADKHEWFAMVSLQEGKIMACSLLSKQDGRQLLTGQHVIDALTHAGPLSWNLETAAHRRNLPSPSGPVSEDAQQKRSSERKQILHQSRQLNRDMPAGQTGVQLVPHRTMQGSHAASSGSWPREHRQVFALIDGHHSVEDLSRLLHKPLHELLPIVYQLRGAGFIEIIETSAGSHLF
jgi:hypothetical protein